MLNRVQIVSNFLPPSIKVLPLLPTYPPYKQHTKLKPSSTSNSLFHILMLCPLTTSFSSYYNVLKLKTRSSDVPSLNFITFNDISIVSPSFRAGVLAFHGTWHLLFIHLFNIYTFIYHRYEVI